MSCLSPRPFAACSSPQPSAVSEESLYSVLGVHLLATQSEIRKAYRLHVLRFHPDRTRGEEAATEVFLRIQKAYEVLSDEATRADYDLLLLYQLHVEEYLRRFVDLTLTAQGLQLGMDSGSSARDRAAAC